MDTRNISHRFAEKAGIQPKEAIRMIEAIGATIAEACGNLDIVAIPGFGNFSAQKKDECIVEDPDTKKRNLYPPVIVSEFRASVILRNRLSK